MNSLNPLPSIERAILALLEATYAPLDGHPERIGGELPGALSDLYIRIEKGTGSSTRLEGSFLVDIETFHPVYDDAENAGLALEAILLGYPHVVEVGGQKVVFDLVQQNQGPSEIPWHDDNVHRLLASYVITVRRR